MIRCWKFHACITYSMQSYLNLSNTNINLRTKKNIYKKSETTVWCKIKIVDYKNSIIKDYFQFFTNDLKSTTMKLDEVINYHKKNIIIKLSHTPIQYNRAQ